MNRSNVRSSNEEGVQGQVVDSYIMNNVDEQKMMLFDDDDYENMVENNSDSGNMLRPESPYQIPAQAKLDHSNQLLALH